MLCPVIPILLCTLFNFHYPLERCVKHSTHLANRIGKVLQLVDDLTDELQSLGMVVTVRTFFKSKRNMLSSGEP